MPNESNPQDLNRFAYVRNNPLRYIDPSGHIWCDGVTSCAQGGSARPGSGAAKKPPPPPRPKPAPNPNKYGNNVKLPPSTSTLKPARRSASAPATTQAPTQQTSEPPWGPSQSPDDDWVDLGFDWLLQHGPNLRYFGEGDYMVEELKRHHGVVDARRAALNVDYPPGVPFHHQHDFGPDGYELAWKELDGTGHFLGSYDVYITDNGGGTATITVLNRSGLASFTNLRLSGRNISAVELLESGQPLFVDGVPQFRTVLRDLPRDQTIGFGGNYDQVYTWQEEWP